MTQKTEFHHQVVKVVFEMAQRVEPVPLALWRVLAALPRSPSLLDHHNSFMTLKKLAFTLPLPMLWLPTPHQSIFLLTGPNHLLRVSSVPLIPPPLLGACMELLAIHGQKQTLSEGHRQWVPWVTGSTIMRWQTSWDPTYRKRNTTSLAPLLRYVLCIGTRVCCFVK